MLTFFKSLAFVAVIHPTIFMITRTAVNTTSYLRLPRKNHLFLRTQFTDETPGHTEFTLHYMLITFRYDGSNLLQKSSITDGNEIAQGPQIRVICPIHFDSVEWRPVNVYGGSNFFFHFRYVQKKNTYSLVKRHEVMKSLTNFK